MMDTAWKTDLRKRILDKLSWECDVLGSAIPYILENGAYADYAKSRPNWWTNGFWPGILWLLYGQTREEKYLAAAQKVEDTLFEGLRSFEQSDHDLGFRWTLSAVANYRLTGNQEARKRGLMAATLLAGRYNPAGKFIRAWDMPERVNWMIVDCLMNLPLLYWAAQETEDERFAEIATNHLQTSLRHLHRADGSSNHVAIVDTATGALIDAPGGQGYEKGSAWSRGQAWALYGYALAHRYTRRQDALDAAKRTAHFIIAAVMETDYVPLLDFRAPETPRFWDTTAGAIAACGLLEIAGFVPEYEKALYANAAARIVAALEAGHCNWDMDALSILQNGSVMYHAQQKNVPIIYGDFFLLEAALKLGGSKFHIW